MRLPLLLLSLAPSFVAPAWAVVAITNIGQPTSDRAPISYNQWEATSFELADIASDWDVQVVSLRLGVTAPNQNVHVAITGSAGNGAPNLSDVYVHFNEGQLRTETMPVGTTVSLMADSANSRTLTANARYWLVFGVSAPDTEGAGGYAWDYAGSSSVTAEPGWQIGPIGSAGTAGAGWSTSTDSPYIFSVTADHVSPIPEPRMAALLCFASLMMLSRRRS